MAEAPAGQRWKACYECGVPSTLQEWDDFSGSLTRSHCPECGQDHFRNHEVTVPQAYVAIKEAISEEYEKLERLKARKEKLEKQLLDECEREGVTRLPVYAGRYTLYLKRDAYLKKETDREIYVPALKRAGLSEFVREDVVKEVTLARYITKHRPDLRGALTAVETFSVNVRKKQ